ncbi:MAG: hypothetical protein Q8O81_03655 [Giesbergeria sp.]|nr:hypothetical protein [Giesbergeria sp.]
MRALKHRLFLFLPVLLAGAVLGWLLTGKGLQHDAPRTLPWPVPDHRPAHATHAVLPDGRLRIAITHLPLTGIRPEMLAWWYRKLPISTVDIGDIRYPFYHVFHPTEHGRIRVVEPAQDGQSGMGVGALVEREEWFGPFDSKGAGRVTRLDATGMTVVPEVAGLRFGEIEHLFDVTPNGTQYRVVSTIGVEWPLVGGMVNWAIRRAMYPDAMLRQWERHQIEEVGMLQHFLPALYASQPQGNAYRLAAPTQP